MNNIQAIVITYNRIKYLPNIIGKLVNSPIKDITVLDNCSDDGTEQYIKQFPQIKYIKNNKNIGGNANICRAYEIATADYIWVLCDDDELNFNGWNKVEEAMNAGFDCIMVANYIKPKRNIAQFIGQATFVPACIYKTSIIDSTVVSNMYSNIVFMFPHLAILAKVINNNLRYTIMDEWIVKLVGHPGEESYTRGLLLGQAHPIYAGMYWQLGMLNSLRLFKSREIQQEFIRNFVMSSGAGPFFSPITLASTHKKLARGNPWHLQNMIACLDIVPDIQRGVKRLLHI